MVYFGLQIYNGVLLHLSSPLSLNTLGSEEISSGRDRAGLSYHCSVCFFDSGLMFVVSGITTSTSGSLSRAGLQHSAVVLVISLSSGLRECIHCGRKSQLRSVFGRCVGLWDCIRLTRRTKMVSAVNGAPTPTMACHPAREMPNTRQGSSRKHTRR